MDRKTGEPQEVQAVYVETGDFQSIIGYGEIHPLAATGTVLAARSGYYPQLAVSLEGDWLALASCGLSTCDLIAAQPGSGIVHHWSNFSIGERGDDRIWGIAGGLLIGTSSCADGDCGPFALDLETGARSDLDLDPMTSILQVIHGPHGPLVLAGGGDQGAGTWGVESLDLTDRSLHAVFSATFEPMQTVVGLAETYGAGAELPPGWFLIYRNADAAPAPYPDYSAATLGGTAEVPLPVMTFPH